MDANTVTVISAVLAAIPPTLLALAAWRQGKANGAAQIITADKADVAAASAGVAAGKAETAAGLIKENTAKTDEVIAGNVKIHELVNSGSDKMKLEIAALKDELQRANARTDKLAATIEGLLTHKAGMMAETSNAARPPPVQVEVVNLPLVVTTDPKEST